MADTGITYRLGDANAGAFNITPDTGSITYLTSQTALANHTISVIATDKGGNTDSIRVIINVVFSDNADLANLLVASSLTSAGEPTTLIPITRRILARPPRNTPPMSAAVSPKSPYSRPRPAPYLAWWRSAAPPQTQTALHSPPSFPLALSPTTPAPGASPV